MMAQDAIKKSRWRRDYSVGQILLLVKRWIPKDLNDMVW